MEDGRDGSSHFGEHRWASRKDFPCDLKIRTALGVITIISVTRLPYLKYLGRAIIQLRTYEVKWGVKPNGKCWNENKLCIVLYTEAFNKLCSLKKSENKRSPQSGSLSK